MVWDYSGLLFYNTFNGQAAVASTLPSQSSRPDIVDDLKMNPSSAIGGGWTHVGGIGSNILFYN